MLSGGLVILDGIHRLPIGLLDSSIGHLLTTSEIDLPDGTQLVSQSHYETLLELHSEAQLEAAQIAPVHRSFRVIAIGEPVPPPARSWLSDDVLTLFHFHEVELLTDKEHICVLACIQTTLDAHSKPVGESELRMLLKCALALLEAVAADETLMLLRLSTRRLIRIVRHLRCVQTKKHALANAILQELSAPLALLPLQAQQAVCMLLDKHLSSNLSAKFVGTEGQSTAEKTQEARNIKTLQDQAVKLRTASMWGQRSESQEKALNNKVEAMYNRKEEHASQAAHNKRTEALEVLDGTASVGRVQVTSDTVSIDGICLPRRAPSSMALVPSIEFHDIPKHVDVLRNMMHDWMLGYHLLLIGNQGQSVDCTALVAAGVVQVLAKTSSQTGCCSCCEQSASTYKCIGIVLFSLSLSRQH